MRYKKAGVMLAGLTATEPEQGHLFEGRAGSKEATLMKAVDALNRQVGRGTARFGGVRGAVPDAKQRAAPEGWQMQRARLSPHYTMRWEDVPVTKT